MTIFRDANRYVVVPEGTLRLSEENVPVGQDEIPNSVQETNIRMPVSKKTGDRELVGSRRKGDNNRR